MRFSIILLIYMVSGAWGKAPDTSVPTETVVAISFQHPVSQGFALVKSATPSGPHFHLSFAVGTRSVRLRRITESEYSWLYFEFLKLSKKTNSSKITNACRNQMNYLVERNKTEETVGSLCWETSSKREKKAWGRWFKIANRMLGFSNK